MSYIGKAPGVGVRNRYYFTATGGETSLSGTDDASNTLAFSDGKYVDVTLNGVTLVAGTDYDTATANTIDNLTALTAGDVVEVVVYDVFSIAAAVPPTGGTFTGLVQFDDQIIIPRGTTAQRPASPVAGSVRFNTSANAYEGYDGAGWVYLSDVTLNIEHLIVAGGGGGGAGFTIWAVGGGGGAGGAIEQTSSFGLGTAYTITVGAGGAAGVWSGSASNPDVPGGNGANSVFSTSMAIGGGGGGAWQSSGASNAKSGGSGGGSGNSSGLRDPGAGTAGQGNDGGTGIAYTGNSTSGGGGGGGYSSAGASATNSNAGDGGAGLTSSLTGSSLVYAAGGGGGGSNTTVPGSGVSGVSGNGGNTQGGVLPTAGTSNRGGGGGGGSSTNSTAYNGAAGGSGVIILKVPAGFSASFSAGVSQTSTTVGTDTVYTITAAGASDTVTFS